ncbi:hypothetical protein [Archangium sp.]|jgi:hypothetical protein|uniref:hypothetical protein n=1 Tax=Archangium sp. TaxID=1872627 RepID=UPI002ED8B43A
MSDGSLSFDIREVPDPEGGLVLKLLVEGDSIATARASADVLAQMQERLGMDRTAVAAELRLALREHIKKRFQKVLTFSKPIEEPSRPLRFHSEYTYRDLDSVDAGLVWYDVRAGETGPESVPEVVRNKMRSEVHKHLTSSTTTTQEIIKLLE